MTMKTPLLLAQLVLATTALGCATIPDWSPSTQIDTTLAVQKSVQHNPSRSSRPSTKIVDQRDLITIRPWDESRYICNNGNPLICDRVGATAYCTCPGIWR